MQIHTRLVAVGLASVAAAVGAAPTALADVPANSISVTGTGNATTAATGATFSAGVSATAATTRVALTKSTKRIRAVRAALLKAGVPAADLTTEGVSTYRQDRKHAVAQQTLDVKVERVSDTGRLITIANRAGATNVYGPQFTYESTDAAYQKALGLAIANARVKAELIATIIQKTIDGTLAVSEGGADTGVVVREGAASSASADGAAATPAPKVPIRAPVSTVEADVVVVYTYH
jgi:uncharacterized protein YggE